MIAAVFGCSRTPAPDPPSSTDFTPVKFADPPGVHNLLRLTDRLYSGSSPEGDAGFQSLRDLGIKTVISVDGAKPDVATAKRFGLRYVHLPIGYNGVPRETAVRIARAVRDLPGPAYIHCHHGTHRGPSAAAAALRCLDDRCPASAAMDILRTAGTDPKYKGLFASVESSAAATPAEWDRAGQDFPETAPVPDLARLMAGIDERWDRLKLVRAAGWKAVPDHPDVDPTHEALQLMEHFFEVSRLNDPERPDKEFRQMLADAEASAADLEKALRASPPRADTAAAAYARSSSLCAKCHERYRDK
ncbi:hypothetical protein FRUB_09840 [Fimbriiglobus ruber]|uniref:Uncharacterized protein n=1 Tax=Fimbriiglobus ruber TaxID=1908690 RepID=A0A225D8Y2_9BACT|nr:hypothetical protein FRUB_09840 [Fimbriiglobus ruber]